MKYIQKYKYLISIIVLSFIIVIWIVQKKKLINNQYDIEEDIEIINTKQPIETTTEPSHCVVDIKGEVINPNLYEVLCSSRVNDVINLAGGLTPNANTSDINLARKIFDQMVIVIPTKELEIASEAESEIPINDALINENNNIDCLININTATLEELKKIPGIGEKKASTIIEYRNNNGLFKNIHDITSVKGIGEKLYAEIKIYITT